MLQLNEELFELKVNSIKQSEVNLDDQQESEAIKTLVDSHRKKIWMIIGEGSVFLTLLIIAAIILHVRIRKEHELNAQQRNFLLAVTHEIKSPLTSIKLVLQTFGKRDLDEETKTRFLNNSLADVERLDSMLDDTLMAARLSQKGINQYKERFNLSETVRNIITRLSEEYEGTFVISAEIADNIEFTGDRLGLSSVISNLIQNARKYASENGTCDVFVEKSGGEVIIRVADNGPGIAKNERKMIFKKFYRIGDEETRDTSGTGLGLYIVHEVVKMHRGIITVTDNKPQGTIFEIKIPDKDS